MFAGTPSAPKPAVLFAAKTKHNLIRRLTQQSDTIPAMRLNG